MKEIATDRKIRYIILEDLDFMSMSGVRAPIIPVTRGARTEDIEGEVVISVEQPIPINPIVAPAAKCGPKLDKINLYFS